MQNDFLLIVKIKKILVPDYTAISLNAKEHENKRRAKNKSCRRCSVV